MANVLTGLISDASKTLRQFVSRYLLLVAYPDRFYERHIKNKGKKELKQAIVDAVAVTAVLITIIGLFLKIPGLKELLPQFVISILSNKYLLFATVIAFSLPAFLLVAAGMKLMGARSQDAIFVYFNSLTMVLLAILTGILAGILFQSITILLYLAFGELPSMPGGMIVWLLVLSTIFYGWMAVLFYVPCRLIERSANSSAFAAAMLCVISFVVPSTASLYAVSIYMPMSPPFNYPQFRALDEPPIRCRLGGITLAT